MSNQNERLTANAASDLFFYDPESGELFWKQQHGSKRVWDQAGTPNSRGEIIIRYLGRCYYAHRIAWAIMVGEWPAMIDHVNGNPSDNRWSNIRLATAAQNMHNKGMQKNNKSGFKGVYACSRSGRFRAIIRDKGKCYHLGLFDTAEEAGAAYFQAAKERFGEYARMA